MLCLSVVKVAATASVFYSTYIVTHATVSICVENVCRDDCSNARVTLPFNCFLNVHL